MVNGEDIHNFEKTLERIREQLKNPDDEWEKISSHNRNKIKNFLEHLEAKQISVGRLVKYAYFLKTIAKLLNKNFDLTSKKDIQDLVLKIQRNKSKTYQKHYTPNTIKDFKVVIKVFWQWLRETEDYPEEVRWIKCTSKSENNLPKDLLTIDEVEKLANASSNPRDKAFVLVLFESGARVGELLSLKIKNVQVNDYGIALTVSGKTGDRRIPIIKYATNLLNWINAHPTKDDIESPVWVGKRGFGAKEYEVIGYHAVVKILENLAKISGIKKPVNPHIFRHSRATLLAEFLSDAQMKEYFGWTQSSTQTKTYVHLSGKNIDKALLNHYGIYKEEIKERENIKTIVKCPRCKQANDPNAKACSNCWFDFNLQKTMENIQKSAGKKKKINEVLRTILNALSELEAEDLERIKEKIDERKWSKEIVEMSYVKSR